MVRRQKAIKGPNMKVLINKFRDGRFSGGGGGGGGSERNVHGTFLVTKSICEPSLIKLIHDYH